jgi:hypothetical protein
MNPKKPRGVDIDAVNLIIRPIWEDGTPKSMYNDFNWKAPRAGVNQFRNMRPPQAGPNNTNFNIQFSANIPGAILAYAPTPQDE